jgi:hypothetical protein
MDDAERADQACEQALKDFAGCQDGARRECTDKAKDNVIECSQQAENELVACGTGPDCEDEYTKAIAGCNFDYEAEGAECDVNTYEDECGFTLGDYTADTNCDDVYTEAETECRKSRDDGAQECERQQEADNATCQLAYDSRQKECASLPSPGDDAGAVADACRFEATGPWEDCRERALNSGLSEDELSRELNHCDLEKLNAWQACADECNLGRPLPGTCEPSCDDNAHMDDLSCQTENQVIW